MKIIFISFLIICYASLLLHGAYTFAQNNKDSVSIPLSINEAMLIAVNNNLDIKLAQIDSKIKGTELSYKEAVFDTILNGEINYTNDQKAKSSSLIGSKNLTNTYNIGIDKKLRSGTDIGIDFTNKREWTNSSFISTNPYHESQMSITLTQPIAKNFFGLIDLGKIEIIKYEIKNAELDSYIKIEAAMIQAEKAYWKTALMQEQFSIKKEILKKAIILFNQSRRKLKIGLIETGDVLAAESNMHIRESNLLTASNDLATAEELLKVRLNLDNSAQLFLTTALPCLDINPDFRQSLNTAFGKRRGYLSKKNDLENKNINLKLKKNSLFPEIDLKATFANNGINSKYYKAVTDIFEDSNPEYSIGIEFSYPLENNEAKSEHEKAELEKVKVITELQRIERQIISDIDTAIRNLNVNKINISKMARVENLQRGKLFHEERSFQYGRSKSDTLIRYQEDLLNAQLMKQNALFDYRISILDLLDSEDSFLEYTGLE